MNSAAENPISTGNAASKRFDGPTLAGNERQTAQEGAVGAAATGPTAATWV